jgi:ribonuclease HII
MPGRRWDPIRFDRRRLADLGPDARCLAGADEAGRGCLAGPLVAAAVVFDYSRVPARALAGIDDSKALTRARREELYGRILTAADRVVSVSAGTIDTRGLHRCNLAALAQALAGLAGAYDLALIDGFDVCRPELRAQAVVGGDGKSAAVGAASIVAKVVRDRLMRGLDDRHPDYGFAQHVGYGTPRHREALRLYGPSVLHRRSFAGVDDRRLELF